MHGPGGKRKERLRASMVDFCQTPITLLCQQCRCFAICTHGLRPPRDIDEHGSREIDRLASTMPEFFFNPLCRCRLDRSSRIKCSVVACSCWRGGLMGVRRRGVTGVDPHTAGSTKPPPTDAALRYDACDGWCVCVSCRVPS